MKPLAVAQETIGLILLVAFTLPLADDQWLRTGGMALGVAFVCLGLYTQAGGWR